MSDSLKCNLIEINNNWFQRQLFKIKKTNDKEEAYQTYIVYPILECAINKIEGCSYELIDTHTFRKRNTMLHDRSGYSSLAIAAPDLIIAKNFVLHNRENDKAEYAVAVEIKKIDEDEMLGKSFSSDDLLYDDNILVQLIPQLLKKQSVILTNLRVWEFIVLKEDVDIEKSGIYEYFKIIENCGIDVKDEVSDLDSKINELCILLKTKTEKEDLKSFNDVLSFLEKQTCWNKSDKKDIEILKNSTSKIKKLEIKQIQGLYGILFEKIVKYVNKEYEQVIRDFYKNDCAIETKMVLPNDKKYVVDVNVQKRFDDILYIKSADSITFVKDDILNELIDYIENFISNKLNTLRK